MTMDNNEEHRRAVLNQGKMKDNDITHWLKMENVEGNLYIELNRLYDIKMTEDMNELDIMDINVDM